MKETKLVQDLLIEMKTIDRQIKMLTEKKDKMKKQLIEIHFQDNEEFIDTNGFVLATYKKSTRVIFNSDSFKKDHGDVYAMYSKPVEIQTFLLK